MERMPSIFNDVLSPVTPGPSSSNTCGPYRIARLARALLGEPPRRITVRMARRGGYYDTFYSMHSHEAILAALLGQELLRCDLSTMCRQADEAGLCYDFQFVDDLPVRPSELAEMDHIVPLDDVVALMLAVGEKIRPCDEAGTYILKKEEA